MEYAIFIVVALFVIFFVNKKPAKKKYLNYIDPTNQLSIVAQGDFYKRKLMNKEESYLYRKLENTIKRNKLEHMVFAQVSFGEIIGSKDKAAYGCINSKRADFVIVTRYGDPLAVFEYQSGAHYQGNAIQRDAVKKEACRKAGIAYFEITPGYSDSDIDICLKRITV